MHSWDVKTSQLDIPSSFQVAQVACGANFSAQLLLLVSELSVVIKAYWVIVGCGGLIIINTYSEVGGERDKERVCQYKYENSCMTISAGVGRVFTWGYGNDGQLANNENKGRYVSSAGCTVDPFTYVSFNWHHVSEPSQWRWRYYWTSK